MTTERYQSVKCSATYLDYLDFVTTHKDYFQLSDLSPSDLNRPAPYLVSDPQSEFDLDSESESEAALAPPPADYSGYSDSDDFASDEDGGAKDPNSECANENDNEEYCASHNLHKLFGRPNDRAQTPERADDKEREEDGPNPKAWKQRGHDASCEKNRDGTPVQNRNASEDMKDTAKNNQESRNTRTTREVSARNATATTQKQTTSYDHIQRKRAHPCLPQQSETPAPPTGQKKTDG